MTSTEATTVAVTDTGYGTHKVTVGPWKFSVDTTTGRLFRVYAGPDVAPHGETDPPGGLTAILGDLDVGRWLGLPECFYRVDIPRLTELAEQQTSAAAAAEAAKPAWWLTPMTASTRGAITTGEIAGLWTAVGRARKAHGDAEGAHQAAMAAYGVRLAEAFRWRQTDTRESFQARVLRIKPPTPPRPARSRRVSPAARDASTPARPDASTAPTALPGSAGPTGGRAAA